MQAEQTIFINIHGHRQANNIQEWVMMNLMAMDYPPEDIDFGYYSVGFHPYNVGKVDTSDTLAKVRLATENPNVFAIGEIGLDKTIGAPLEQQREVFEAQVDIAEFAELPIILHVEDAYLEMIEYMKTHKPSIPMIIHGFHGNAEMAETLVQNGFLVSFGQAIATEHSMVVESLHRVPLDKLFLETDEGDLDIREIYHFASEVKGISIDRLRAQIFENAKSYLGRFNDMLESTAQTG